MILWPRTLFGRVSLILATGLGLAWALSLGSAMRAGSEMADRMMLAYVSSDVASSLAVLERLPAAERAAWLERLERPNYHFRLESPGGTANDTTPASPLAQALAERLGAGRVQTVTARGEESTLLALRLGDGTPLTLVLQPPSRSLPGVTWLRWSLQAVLVGLGLFLAIRVATRPLAQLAQAALRLADDPNALPVDERGPIEVQRAAVALNAMRRRIDEQAKERLQILAAVSHDLRTPLTRMRVRCDLLPDDALRGKFQADLAEMQQLVEEGLQLAATEHAATEPVVAVDLHALLDAIVCDFADAGRPVRWAGRPGPVLNTRPRALRRTVGNLLDNALKFGAEAELQMHASPNGLTVRVLDRGPGIAPEQLGLAMRPFLRLDESRNRDGGGTGLGLAIAERLAAVLGAPLQLRPREGGGLEAELCLTHAPAGATA